MLTAYQQQTQRLLNDEAEQFYNIADLTTYINNARADIAKRTEVLIATATLNTGNGTQSYSVGALTPPGNLSQVLNIRSITLGAAAPFTRLEHRSWQWASNYWFSGAASAVTGNTTGWAVQTLGSNGTLWLNPTPNGNLTLNIEASWTPIALVTDSTGEALPYPYTDAVPFFAAYEAYLQAQRNSDAQNMMENYLSFLRAARLGATSQWMPVTFPTPKGQQSAIDEILSGAGPAAKPAASGEATP